MRLFPKVLLAVGVLLLSASWAVAESSSAAVSINVYNNMDGKIFASVTTPLSVETYVAEPGQSVTVALRNYPEGIKPITFDNTLQFYGFSKELAKFLVIVAAQQKASGDYVVYDCYLDKVDVAEGINAEVTKAPQRQAGEFQFDSAITFSKD